MTFDSNIDSTDVLIPVLATDVYFRRASDIMVGDKVFDRNGIPVRVTELRTEYGAELYELELADGRRITCSGDQTWLYKSRYGNGSLKWRIATTTQLMAKNSIKHYSKGRTVADIKFVLPMNKPVQWSEKAYEFTPYSVGRIIGEQAFAEQCDLYLLYKYIYGSVEQRWQFIQGLFDVNGKISQRTGKYALTFKTISEQYALLLQQLLNSLGISSNVKLCKRKLAVSADVYVVTVKISNQDKTRFFLDAKKSGVALEAAQSDKAKVRVKKYGETIGIREIRKLDQRGKVIHLIVNSDDGTYQTNNFVVTHDK